MTHAPQPPKEQRSFADKGTRVSDDVPTDRRDLKTNAQSGQPGDADINLEQQGRYGNLAQNLTTQQKR